MENKSTTKEKRRSAFIISIAVFVAVLALSLLYLKRCTNFFGYFEGKPETDPPFTDTHPGTGLATEGETGTEEPELPDNPIDFEKQQEINDEIYAWIRIPNTNVDYPILQSRVDDLYYLRRGLDKSYYVPGVIFTQSSNKRDFTDPVTLIYGHNMTEDGSMFATLHNFEDKEFFDSNEFFYIYTPGHILTYRVVSAYKYDNRHIMYSFDFDNEEVRRDYFDYVMSPAMIPMNVREGVLLSTDDKLVVLSTCMADNRYRYLVNGVLIGDEITE